MDHSVEEKPQTQLRTFITDSKPMAEYGLMSTHYGSLRKLSFYRSDDPTNSVKVPKESDY